MFFKHAFETQKQIEKTLFEKPSPMRPYGAKISQLHYLYEEKIISKNFSKFSCVNCKHQVKHKKYFPCVTFIELQEHVNETIHIKLAQVS